MPWKLGGQYWGQQNPGPAAFNDGGYEAQTIEELTNLPTLLELEDWKRLLPWSSEKGIQEVPNPPPPSPDVQQQTSTDSLDDVLCVIEEMWPQQKQEYEYRAQQNGGQYGGKQNPGPVAFNDGRYRAQTIEEHTNVTGSLKRDYWNSPNFGPSTFPPTPNVAKYVELPTFTPPANTLPAMTYHGTPVYAAGWNIAPTFGGKKEEKEAEGPYIKKPLNAFMLFIKRNRMSAEAELGVSTSTEVNKLLAERWKSLSPAQREIYVGEAKVDAFLHAMKNRGWSHKNKDKRKKRKQNWAKVVCDEKTDKSGQHPSDTQQPYNKHRQHQQY